MLTMSICIFPKNHEELTSYKQGNIWITPRISAFYKLYCKMYLFIVLVESQIKTAS